MYKYLKKSQKMRTKILVDVFVFLLGYFFTVSVQAQRPPAELELIPINDSIYVIHNQGVPGNATALITDEGVLLVDDKFEADYENMVELLRSVTDQPVRYVVNTHYHQDHSGSNARFKAAGADIVMTAQARERMVEVNQSGLPRFTMEESARIHIGGEVVDLLYFGRAHTGGDLVVYFPDYQILVAGDLFNYGAIFGDGPQAAQLVDYAGGGSVREWTKTLDAILMLGFETVVPGHGIVTTKTEMRRFRDSTLELRSRIQGMLRQGNSREAIEQVLRGEFGWQNLHMMRGFDGILGELR